MPTRNVVLNVADVHGSVAFYSQFLGAKAIGQPTPNRAVMDMATATLELRQLSSFSVRSATGVEAA